MVEQHRPEVVLLDLGLPVFDGYEVARRVRRLAGGDAVMLIALSGYAEETDRQRSKEAGFDLHFAKMDDLDKVEAAVSSYSMA
jgi:CheY-like chemotaxis protein